MSQISQDLVSIVETSSKYLVDPDLWKSKEDYKLAKVIKSLQKINDRYKCAVTLIKE